MDGTKCLTLLHIQLLLSHIIQQPSLQLVVSVIIMTHNKFLHHNSVMINRISDVQSTSTEETDVAATLINYPFGII